MKVPLALIGALLAVGTFGACSTEGKPDSDDQEQMIARPEAVPASEGEVRSSLPATVLDDGDGHALCLGTVLPSRPPQCEGTPVVGWDWDEHPEHEQASGVRWGQFEVTGTFDGTTFTVTGAVPWDERETQVVPKPPLGTPCQEPEDGWEVVDPSRTTVATRGTVLRVASALPTYSMGWLDRSQDPEASDDPTKVIVNVAVTGDTAKVEETLRQVWGGALCVSVAEHTRQELDEVRAEVVELPGALSAGVVGPDRLEIQVFHDDGSIQAWVDQEYGEGLVIVEPALVPVD